MHTGIRVVSPAQHIDPAYAQHLDWAVANGLEIYTLFNDITTSGIYPQRLLGVED
jgi:DNA-binding sugar fermentation-stimulating protein